MTQDILRRGYGWFRAVLRGFRLIRIRGSSLVPGVSVYPRVDRNRWYAKVRDPKTLKWRGIPTPFRLDAPAAKRNALVWAADRDRLGSENIKLAKSEMWERWVTVWLHQAFGYNRNTLIRYTTAWAHLFEFLEEHEIRLPRELLYRHAFEYMAWRTKQVRRRGTTINHNTALTEAKVMSRIMEEARRREYITANPWMRLGIRRQNVRHAPPMTAAEIARARSILLKEEGSLPITKRWKTLSFEIALLQAVRLMETAVPMARVHLDVRTKKGLNLDRITFEVKGSNAKKRTKTLPINPELRPWLLELCRAGAEWTCVFPVSKDGVSLAAIEWWRWRQQHDFSHVTFHSTRSTAATQLHRNGVSLQKAKEILGHHSDAVHQGYLHLTAEDLEDAMNQLSFAKPAKGKTPDGR